MAQGLLTDRYLNGIPEDSREADASVFLKKEVITDELIEKANKLNEVALNRGQSLAQMALSWVVRDKKVTSVMIGTSKVSQIESNLGVLKAKEFTEDELERIEKILGE